MSKLLITIDDDKEVTLFINTLNKVNQIMKKFDIEGDEEDAIDLNVGYNIFDFTFESYLYKANCVPREIYINDIWFNSKQQEIIDRLNNELGEDLNLYIDDTQKLYSIIKDYKKLITSIEIYDDCVLLKTSRDKWKFNRNVEIKEDFIKLTGENVSIVLDKDNEPDELYKFLKTKGIFTLYFDTEDLAMYVNELPFDENDEYYDIYMKNIIKMIISQKYITGTSGCKVENCTLTININCIEGTDDINQIDFVINNNNKITITNSYIVLVN